MVLKTDLVFVKLLNLLLIGLVSWVVSVLVVGICLLLFRSGELPGFVSYLNLIVGCPVGITLIWWKLNEDIIGKIGYSLLWLFIFILPLFYFSNYFILYMLLGGTL